MIWEQHYEAHDLDMNKAVFDEALADIGENLARRSEAGFSNARLSSRPMRTRTSSFASGSSAVRDEICVPSIGATKPANTSEAYLSSKVASFGFDIMLLLLEVSSDENPSMPVLFSTQG